MTDLEKAADLLARTCPIGFSTPEDNALCCAILDTMARDVLNLEGELSEPGKGLGEMLRRMEDLMTSMKIEIMSEKTDKMVRDFDDLMERSKALLARFPGGEVALE